MQSVTFTCSFDTADQSRMSEKGLNKPKVGATVVASDSVKMAFVMGGMELYHSTISLRGA